MNMPIHNDQRPSPGERLHWATVVLKYLRWGERDVYYTWTRPSHGISEYGITPRQALRDHFGVLDGVHPALLSAVDDVSVRKYVPGRRHRE